MSASNSHSPTTNTNYLQVYAAANVFRYIASIILLGIVILPVTIALRKQAGYDTRLVKVVHSIVLALVAVFGIVQVTMWDYNNIVTFTGGKRIERKAADALLATYFMLYFVAALAGGANIVTSCLAMRRKDIPKSVSLCAQDPVPPLLISYALRVSSPSLLLSSAP